MSLQTTYEVHIYVETTEQKNVVRRLLDRTKQVVDMPNRDNSKIYSIYFYKDKTTQICPNSPAMQHLKPMVNLKELQEIVLLISLGIPAEEAISTITKQGYDS